VVSTTSGIKHCQTDTACPLKVLIANSSHPSKHRNSPLTNGSPPDCTAFLDWSQLLDCRGLSRNRNSEIRQTNSAAHRLALGGLWPLFKERFEPLLFQEVVAFYQRPVAPRSVSLCQFKLALLL
jgi:hypothetical protein